MPRGPLWSARVYRSEPSGPSGWIFVPTALGWAAAVALAATRMQATPYLVAAAGLTAVAASALIRRWVERERWERPIRTLARNLSAFNDEPDKPWALPGSGDLLGLIEPVRTLQERFLALRDRVERRGDEGSANAFDSGDFPPSPPGAGSLTRSGAYEPPDTVAFEMMASHEFSSLDMINRLEPKTWRWLESSATEQEFLGWNLTQLREKSFLDIVHADDRELARQQLRTVLARGEGHGLVYKIITARGETRSVELNVGARYGNDRRVTHLRCHMADVTAKVRDEDELRRRTHELIQANDRLRRANRELQELKDRYSDLYQNAPAMYFNVDRHGITHECNETLLQTLGYRREELIGRPFARVWPGTVSDPTPRWDAISGAGPFEFEGGWRKKDGETLAARVAVSGVVSGDGKIRQYRCVAQDVSARRLLETELRVKNEHLAQANQELSRKNRELDEFTYVVSHDLQEPLRTLIAFSDFLLRDQADRLDDEGREYVHHLVAASRRLRNLIRDLLDLSRAGKVTDEFAAVDLNEIVETVQADLAELIRDRRAEILVVAPLATAWGDRTRIGQLLANLIGNGLKYNAGPDARVEVATRVNADGRSLVVSVRDNGIGIDSRYHDRIFQLFRRLHTPEEYEGTGAGLSICLKIAQAHGGRIWVESAPGQGSTFFVSLPTPPV